ncbi:DUF4262 domain-containing protein [Nocardia sp. 348MFTsu5.1]|uniref:DUF4262 domain-containing protein n=1 Tax=Nocardia sp. 348MFTsu5.1 TaxID=1172185 RepID=UPI00037E156B|nr:DUF4262 domain-containing protein [Nocardia sp. 348MFTsu5.1]
MSDYTTAADGLPRWHPSPLVNSTIKRIRVHGWAITAVSGECEFDSPDCTSPECPFGYTTGFGLHSIPELAVYGLDARTSGRVLNELGDLLHVYDSRAIVDECAELSLRSIGAPIRLIELIDKEDLLITNELFPNSPALQVVWPDERGNFPWSDSYTLQPDHQQIKGILPTKNSRRRGPRITPNAGPNRDQRRQAQRRKNRP